MLLFVTHDYCGTRMFQEWFGSEQTGCRFYGYDYADHGEEQATCPLCHLLLDQNYVTDITHELRVRQGCPCAACHKPAPLICEECGLYFCFACFESTHTVAIDLCCVHLIGDPDGTSQAA